MQSAFGGEAKLTSQRAAKLDFLLGQAKCYSNFLREQIADIENQFPTSNGKRKAPAAQTGRAKRRKGAAQPAEDNPDRVSHPDNCILLLRKRLPVLPMLLMLGRTL